jgi:protein-S-isoprenylcysteine O-methyltransferase Ste14
MESESDPPGEVAPSKATGALETPAQPVPAEQPAPTSSRRTLVRLGEQVIFLVAVVGAVALGLGITDYFSDHRYVAAYLLAYAGFRIAEVLIAEESGASQLRPSLRPRAAEELAVLLLFVAAPFERTYLYGGEAPSWLGALGLLLELGGLWLALGSRVQLHFFSADPSGQEHRELVTTGFYRYVRHPTYAGLLLVLIAWPLQYGAPIVELITIAVGLAVAHQEMLADEEILRERFGEQFEEYRRRTDALIPSIW